MAVTTEEDRIAQLIDRATSLAKDRKFQDASRAIREASAIAGPENDRVKEGWKILQEEEGKSPLIEMCKKWVASRDESDGEKALDLARSEQVTSEIAEHALDLLMSFTEEDDVADQVTGELLRYPGAKRLVVQQLKERPTLVFNQLFERGDDSVDSLVSVLLETDVWTSEESRTASQRDVFQLCLAQMMKAGLDHPERAMKAIARLLAAEASHLKGIIDSDGFDVILSSLDIRLPNSLRSQATLATAKLLELSPDTAQKLITNFVTSKVKQPTTDGLIVAFSAAAAIFPITKNAAATLFLTEGFMSGFVDLVQAKQSHRLEQASLELLSAACVDKTCREAINNYCKQWLQDIVTAAMDKRRSTLAALILVKLSEESPKNPEEDVSESEKTTKQNELVARFKKIVLGKDSASKQDSVEGLAYASLQPKIKEQLARDNVFLVRLIQAMADEESSKPIMFGGLTIFVNLTAYRPAQSEEEKRMQQLRAYANTSKPTKPDPLDDDPYVTARCKKVLDANVIPLLVSCSKRASPSVLAQMLQILLSLSKEQKHRGTMAQQGAVKLLLQIWDTLRKSDHPHTASYDPACNYACAHALARVLISVNPAHVFGTSSAIPTTNAIRPLLSLLDDDENSSKRDLLPAFEALLALTNLASIDDDDTTRVTIIRLAFSKLEDLMLSNNTLVQRAAVELICNLMLSPQGVTKFADGSSQASQRLFILVALADVEDLATRRAAGGALAMLTEWDTAVEAVLKRERGVELLLALCKDENEEVRHRGVVCVRNLCCAPGKAGEKGREAVKEKGGKEALTESLRMSRNPGILQSGVEALKALA
jgi:protein unc-45